MTASHVAVVVVENWIVPCSSLDTIIKDNRPQFVTDVFAPKGAAIRAEWIVSTKNHLQTKG